MKTTPSTTRAFGPVLALALLASGGASSLPAAAASQIGARPLTHQDIADYGLPEDTQVSAGLFTVGLGQPVYLEAEVDATIPAADILDVTWSLAAKPPGSTATFEPSPLSLDIPIFSPGDREVYRVASRTLLRPDVAGKYSVVATVTTTTGRIELHRDVTASTYLGAKTCLICHSGGLLSDKRGWQRTGHASFFTKAIDGLKSSHYNANCIACHTVGYDTNALAVNGGFDDVAREMGWTFPRALTNGNWEAMPQALKDLANIQCENCHGPGTTHASLLGGAGAKEAIAVSYSASDCAQCHSEKPYYFKPIEWENSKHAVATRYPTGENREACVRCHSGIGFIDYLGGTSPPRTAYEAITCQACHDPHNADNPHQLRSLADVRLMDGVTTITQGGKGKLCMNCHISRQNAATYVETTTGSARFGPHHGPQTDMLMGVNAVTYGKDIPSSAHRDVVPDTCVTCHLQEVRVTDPVFSHAGGHTFSPSWDGGTPGDPSDDVHLTAACVQCHGPVANFDFKRQDYDGDGVVEGVQTEVKGLLDQLGRLLPPLGDPKVTVTAAYTRPQLRAAYNYLFVLEDKSYGVHNLSYAVGLLKASIADLTDDFDHDGLSDKWEIANFGSLTLYDSFGDADQDGVSNALELAAGTNPNLADTDGDGFSDLVELQAGSDPLNRDDQPGLVVKMYTAGELEFASEVGKTYQIQMVSELSTAWQTVSTNIPGTGQMISHLVSTRSGGSKAFYRVVEVAP
jgi:hypothetical protein